MVWLDEHEAVGLVVGLVLGLSVWAAAGWTVWRIRDRKGKR